MPCSSDLICFLIFVGPILIIAFIIIGIFSALKDKTGLIGSRLKGENHIDQSSLGDSHTTYNISFAKGYLIFVAIYLAYNAYAIFNSQKDYYLLIAFCLVAYIFINFLNRKKLGIFFPMLGLWLMIIISISTYFLVLLKAVSILRYFIYAIFIIGFIVFSIFFVRKFGLGVKK